MKIFSNILYILGWSIEGHPQDKSVSIVAPHTSYMDGVIGYIAMKALGINFKVISAEWLFFWPFKYVMRYVLHAFPCGKHSGNAITNSVNILNKYDKCNLVICPEGRLRAIDKWPKGFYIIAKKAKVGIDIVTLNYKEKKIYIENIQYTDYSYEGLLINMRFNYKNHAYARYPEKFHLPQ